jgi:hypothetical protein
MIASPSPGAVVGVIADRQIGLRGGLERILMLGGRADFLVFMYVR